MDSSQSDGSDDTCSSVREFPRSCEIRTGKRIRGATAQYHIANAHLPDGPASALEFADWPSRLFRNIFASPGGELRKRRVESLYELGEIMHTAFSGAGAPEMVKRMQASMFRSQDFRIPQDDLNDFCKVWCSCDLDPACQTLLTDADCNAAHVFKHIMARIPDVHLQEILQFRKVCPHPTKNDRASIEAGRQAHKQVREYLREHGEQMFGTREMTSSDCLRHPGAACQVNFRRVPGARPLSTFYGGVMCTPTTPFGSRLGDAHPHMDTYAVCEEYLVWSKFDQITIENNKYFNKARLVRRLQPEYKLISLVTCPGRMGWPSPRQRLLCSALRYETVIWLGPDTDEEVEKHFHSIFGARVLLEGDVWACLDSEVNIDNARQKLARTRGIYNTDLLNISLETILPPSGKLRCRDYRAMMPDHSGHGGAFIADLGQNPQKRAVCGAWLPTNRRHCLPCSFTASGKYPEHLFTVRELEFSHGWPVFPTLSPTALTKCLNPTMETLKHSSRLSMVGNGMHLATLMAWSLYIAAHSLRKDTLYVMMPPLLTQSDIACPDSDCDDEEEYVANSIMRP
jgi:hypothetical protein